MDLTSGGITIGHVRGIAIRIHWSWLIIAGLLSWALAEGLFADRLEEWTTTQRWAAGIATTLLFFGSVLLHELSHAFVAQAHGMNVPMITLFVFGGVSSLGGEMESPRQEFRIAIAGPLMSGALAVVFAVIWYAVRPQGVSLMFGYLGLINAALAIFNLLPGFPLDGGRVFRSLVWARNHDLLRATRIASQMGVGLAWTMIAIGLVTIFFFGLFGGIWYVLIGLFLKSASEGSYRSMLVDRALHHVTAGEVMRAAPEPVSPDGTVQELVDQRILTSGDRAYPVVRDGAVIGLVTTTDIMRIPREQRTEMRIEAAMIPAEQIATITSGTLLSEAMVLMQQRDVHQLPVLDEGQLAGMLTRGDVMQQIELRMRFEDSTS